MKLASLKQHFLPRITQVTRETYSPLCPKIIDENNNM
jgi:hypothetical protein